MAKRVVKKKTKKSIVTIKHEEASRTNIPTAEYQSVMRKEEQTPIRIAYERRNRDLDPQLVWRGKDEQDWSDLVVQVPPLYIQEKVHPKVLVDDLRKQTEKQEQSGQRVLNLWRYRLRCAVLCRLHVVVPLDGSCFPDQDAPLY